MNNLSSYEEAVAVRRGAALMPQTLMAFVGASGLSVKIVCRGALLGGGDNLPEGDEAVSHFHLNLYEKARLAYNAQLGVTIDKLEPRLERTCYMSSDADLVYNPSAIPFYTDSSDLAEALKPLQPKGSEPEDIVPGRSRYHSMRPVGAFFFFIAFPFSVPPCGFVPHPLSALNRKGLLACCLTQNDVPETYW